MTTSPCQPQHQCDLHTGADERHRREVVCGADRAQVKQVRGVGLGLCSETFNPRSLAKLTECSVFTAENTTVSGSNPALSAQKEVTLFTIWAEGAGW